MLIKAEYWILKQLSCRVSEVGVELEASLDDFPELAVEALELLLESDPRDILLAHFSYFGLYIISSDEAQVVGFLISKDSQDHFQEIVLTMFLCTLLGRERVAGI